MTHPSVFEVSERELAAVWERIQPRLFSGIERTPDPQVIFVGAQPGAGKTRAIDRLVSQDPGRRYVRLDSDELRKFHPQFDEIMSTDELRMPVLTNQAASAWQRMAVAYARENGFDVVIENSFHTAQPILEEAQRFKEDGYQVGVVAIAVPAGDSRLSMVDRYLTQSVGEPARWTNLASHDLGYEGAPQTVAALAASPSIDRLRIVDRTGQVHYDSDTQTLEPSQVASTLTAARQQPKTPAEARRWLATYSQTLTAAQTSGLDTAPYAAAVMARLAADAKGINEILGPPPPTFAERMKALTQQVQNPPTANTQPQPDTRPGGPTLDDRPVHRQPGRQQKI